MKADYDSEADAIAITLADAAPAALPARTDSVHDRCNVALVANRPVDVEILYPNLGIDEPLAALVGRYDLDLQALKAAARSALEAPDRTVTLEVEGRS